MGIASEVSCAQRKKMLAGIAVTEVDSTTLVKELTSENAPCRENKKSKVSQSTMRWFMADYTAPMKVTLLGTTTLTKPQLAKA